MAYSAQSHIFPPVERASANDYRRLFAWLDENTGQLRYPSEECTTKTVEWCDKPNDEFKNLLKKAEYLDCGSRVSNAGGAGGAGSLIIPKVTWFNPDFHKEFDPLTDTIPGNPSWQPGALGGEEADHKDSKETRKWSYDQAVWEQGGNGVFRDVEYTGVDDYWSAAGFDEESNQIVQSGEGSMISQALHFAEYEPWLQEDYD